MILDEYGLDDSFRYTPTFSLFKINSMSHLRKQITFEDTVYLLELIGILFFALTGNLFF